MLVDVELRERLSHYCMITKQTQAEAANQAIKEMLGRAENDVVIKERMDRAKMLKEELAKL
jgi:hypothetical protein